MATATLADQITFIPGDENVDKENTGEWLEYDASEPRFEQLVHSEDDKVPARMTHRFNILRMKMKTHIWSKDS